MSTKIQKILVIDKNNWRKVSFLELFFVISQIERQDCPSWRGFHELLGGGILPARLKQFIK